MHGDQGGSCLLALCRRILHQYNRKYAEISSSLKEMQLSFSEETDKPLPEKSIRERVASLSAVRTNGQISHQIQQETAFIRFCLVTKSMRLSSLLLWLNTECHNPCLMLLPLDVWIKTRILGSKVWKKSLCSEAVL